MAILNARKMLFSLAWFLFPSTVSQQTSAWFRDIKVRRQKSSSNEHLSSAVREGLSQSLCHESLRAEHARAAQDLARCCESPISASLPELQNGKEHKMAIDEFLIQSSARKSPGWRKTTGQPFQGYRQAVLIVRRLSHPSFSFRVWEPSNCEPDLQRRPHCRTPLSSSLW